MAATVDATMAGRRMPLVDVPNAVNSPIRAGVVAAKRTRTQTDDAHDIVQPPLKKQMLELDQENVDPQVDFGMTKVDAQFPRRSAHIPPTAFEKKLAASREKRHPSTQQGFSKPSTTDRTADRQTKINAENLESIRLWQRHYRRIFPNFVFYLDSVPEDTRVKCNRQIEALKAKEEKFFSNKVTHVVTTRAIPSDAPQYQSQDASQIRRPVSSLTADQRKLTNVLESALQRRINPHAQDARLGPQTPDILVRAKELQIKIWTLEKLQRILRTMFDADLSEREQTHEARNHIATTATTTNATRTTGDAELKKLLRHDQISSDANAQEMVTFKGYYIYVHDMDEKTRPAMARDYPKPNNKADGKWPQFHVTAQGRCPFVEDQSYTKQQRHHDQPTQTRSRATVTTETKPVQALGETSANLRRSPRKSAMKDLLQSKPLDPPKLIPTARHTSQEEVPLFANIQTSSRALPKMIGGMPVASGLQHSNVTSAIRSQVVSSTAISSTAPGMSRRITDSKEITALKRKVLERGASAHSQAPSSYINDMRAAINDESAAPPARAAKRKAQESILGVVHEDGEAAVTVKPGSNAVKKRKSQKDPKPGYCENCGDKFEDFDDHIASRKHQKFARAAENFKDLDALLARLKRPHKAH